MVEGFLTNLDTAEYFFKLCHRFQIKEHKDRLKLMRHLTAKKKAKYLRDPEEFIKGKKVLKFVPKEPPQC